ncbi:extensin [Streptomyces sp. MNP-20]|uniref:extensin n=1 Tax=Streptomyces sp. MNP-20 TaxID=2721165 RepID=UPI001553FA07|nr:extensin [Streptomyces sp. MNP-20]
MASVQAPVQHAAAPVRRRRTPLGAPITPVEPPSAADGELTVQRSPFRRSHHSAIGSLAASAAATVADTLGRVEPRGTERPEDPPPAYSPYTVGSAPVASDDEAPPAYTRVPEGSFDPKGLSDFQVDELVHRMVGRITRLIRTELRMDRERIGRLRDDHR